MINDPNLYFSTSGPFSINAPQPLSCELGQIIYAGTKWNSQATYAHAPAPDFMRPTPHFLLVVTLEGDADYEDDTGVKTVMRKGSLMWTAPGVNQSYGPRDGARWSEFFMWFGGRIFDLWQQQGFPGRQSRHFLLEPFDYWLGRLRNLVAPLPQSAQELPLVRLCRLQQILADALQVAEVGQTSAENSVWREVACGKLAAGTLTHPSLEKIAHSLNMSYSLFRKRFLQMTGKSPGEYRAEEIMRQASLRLLATDDPIADISNTLGFHDQFHFSRRFKQATGMTPSDFRRQARSSSQTV